MKHKDRLKLIFFVVTTSLGSGCEWGSFTPPRPAELSGTPEEGTIGPDRGATSAPASTDLSSRSGQALSPTSGPKIGIRGIELILLRPPMTDREYLTQVVRKETGKRGLSFRLTKPESSEPMTTARLVEAIGKAAALKYALILETRDAPEVCEAIRGFQATGLGLLLLDEKLTCSGPAGPAHQILFGGFPASGEAIVQAAMDEAAIQAYPADGSIAVLRNRTQDAYSSQRQKSLAEALERRKRHIDQIEFEGSESEAYLHLMDYLKTHRKQAIVLADDHHGLLAAYRAHAELSRQGRPAFILAGYALLDVRIGFPGHAACVGFANQDLDVYSRKAAEIVLDLSRGKSVPLQFECELPFVRTPSAGK